MGMILQNAEEKSETLPSANSPLQNNHDEQSSYVMFDKRTINTRSLVSSPFNFR